MLYTVVFLLVMQLNFSFKNEDQIFEWLAIANDLFTFIDQSKENVCNQLVLESIRADIKEMFKLCNEVFENYRDQLGLHSGCKFLVEVKVLN